MLWRDCTTSGQASWQQQHGKWRLLWQLLGVENEKYVNEDYGKGVMCITKAMDADVAGINHSEPRHPTFCAARESGTNHVKLGPLASCTTCGAGFMEMRLAGVAI